MRRSPLYVFKDLNAIGIYNVPIDSTVVIEDSDGNGTSKTIQLVSKEGLSPNTTIGEFLANNSLYTDPFELTEIPSELQKIVDTSTNNVGWRILGRDPSKYAPIGNQAIDFSVVTENVGLVSSYGASGGYSIAEGLNTQALGIASHAMGMGTVAKTQGSVALGTYNIGKDNTIFEVGIGDRNVSINAFEVDTNGVVSAPEMTIDDINAKGITALVTKEYSDANLDSKLDIAGGVITGNLVIEGNLNVNYSSFNNDTIISQTLTIGNNSETQSVLKFGSNFSAADQYPSIFWDNTTTPPNFFVTTGDNQPKKLWYQGNDGHGSGLDADTVDGLEGDDIATKEYVDSKVGGDLTSKYDKTGGPIDGDVLITGSLQVNSQSIFIGDVTIDTIISNLHINGYLASSDDIIADGTITARGDLETGLNADVNKSSIIFTDPSPSINPAFYWNATSEQFEVYIDENNADLKVWHAGNFNPDDKMDRNETTFETLTVNQLLTVGGTLDVSLISSDLSINGSLSASQNIAASGEVLVGMAGNDQSYLRFKDNLTGNTTPTIYWDSTASAFKVDTTQAVNRLLWHSGNLDPNAYLNTSGGTINGNLTVEGELTVNDLTKFNSYVQFLQPINSNMSVNGSILTNNLESLGSIVLGENNGDPKLIFTDSNHTDQPSLYWKHADEDFFVSTPTALDLKVWHAGNFNPDDKMDKTENTFDTLNINTQLNCYGSAIFTESPNIGAIQNISGVFFSGTDINGGAQQFGVYWDDNTHKLSADVLDESGNFFQGAEVWHSENLNPASFVKNMGDTIRGKLTIATDIDGDGNVVAYGDLEVDNIVTFNNLPTSDPGIPGQLWNDAGTLKISQ